MSTRSERLKILELISRGEITTREGTTLLEVLGPPVDEEPPRAEESVTGGMPADFSVKGRGEPARRYPIDWWLLPLGLGISIILLSILGIYLGIRTGGFNLWYLAAAGPYIIGVALIVLGVQLRMKIENRKSREQRAESRE